MRWPFFLVLGVAGLAAAPAGCGAPCDRSNDGNPPIVFREGRSTGAEFETAPPGGPHLFFPGGRRYALVHGLTPPPTLGTVSIALAFAEDGSTSPASGNEVVVQEVTDEHVVVKNDTCADFYLYVHATSSAL